MSGSQPPRQAGLRDRARGMMVGLALGDALGRPIEFLSLEEIRERYGTAGLREPDGPLVPTDDTGMSLAVAEALSAAGPDGPEALMDAIVREFTSWRRHLREEDRPGVTCIEATGRMIAGVPWTETAVSWSKGSGAAMRAAPVGFFFAPYPVLLREVSRMIARSTHGHPTAEAAAVVVAIAVRESIADTPPARWIDLALQALSGMAAREMTSALGAIAGALRIPDEAAAIESLGEGWVSEEAVAMAFTAVLRHPGDFAGAIRCAVNHGGDSDTVGCIAGAIAGAGLGERALPPEWVAGLEGADRVLSAADRLAAAREQMR